MIRRLKVALDHQVINYIPSPGCRFTNGEKHILIYTERLRGQNYASLNYIHGRLRNYRTFTAMETVTLKRTNSDNPDFRVLVTKLDADLRSRNGDMMDFYDHHNIIEKNDTVIIAYIDDKPAGCGCFKAFDHESIEVKRMFVEPAARGNGISKIVLNELESWAREIGFKFAVLESASKQIEAHSLYHKSGYERIKNYAPYVDLPYSFCFRKTL